METEHSRIASKYAEALIEIAFASGKETAEAILSDLEAINKVIFSTADFNILLSHPSINSGTKKKLLSELFSGKAQDLTMRLLNLLVDKRRFALLPYIQIEYKKILQAKEGIVVANLYAAEPIPDKAVASIKEKLASRIGKELDLTVAVDSSLIGGLLLKVGNQVIDGSLKGKLKVMERALLSV